MEAADRRRADEAADIAAQVRGRVPFAADRRR
jgi:hypothetical protein